MRKNICFWTVFVCLVFVIGIVGGIDNGEPLANGLWCLPLFGIMAAAIRVGKLWSDDE